MSPTYAIAARQAKERAMEGPTTPTGPSKTLFRDLNAAASPSPTTSGRYAATTASSTASPEQPSPNGQHAPASPAPSGAAASTSTRPSPPTQGRPGGRGPRTSAVPLPLAVLGGIVVGALVYLWKRRPIYYEVQEDDTLCNIASCFKKRVEDVYKKNRSLLRNPNRLYPGDRLRIR
ncbi:hypothetical protein HYH03_009563 [Edaphochlamys debaryana]|uniref:LysM domain-containing protein n=1 Tax=Edaphochlamys debaryana TaxID=47281 RepID=A0A835Y3X2_9CHLO|nr:hypothetical protein HYH03_009563 [Edaphochlamys debaryana]|eukprot:KAG2492065.1 hypothetical protein HYH03_009563 [Edaphochlamys debaryana]